MKRLIIYDSLSGNIYPGFILTQGAALGYVIVPFQGTKFHDSCPAKAGGCKG